METLFQDFTIQYFESIIFRVVKDEFIQMKTSGVILYMGKICFLCKILVTKDQWFLNSFINIWLIVCLNHIATLNFALAI